MTLSSSLLHSSAQTNTQTHISCLSQTDWKPAEQGQGEGRNVCLMHATVCGWAVRIKYNIYFYVFYGSYNMCIILLKCILLFLFISFRFVHSTPNCNYLFYYIIHTFNQILL